jgi:hypothetical protein
VSSSANQPNAETTPKSLRQHGQLERLGTNEPGCVVCGEDDPSYLELHHIPGRKFGDELVIVCRNCHRKLSNDEAMAARVQRAREVVPVGTPYYRVRVSLARLSSSGPLISRRESTTRAVCILAPEGSPAPSPALYFPVMVEFKEETMKQREHVSFDKPRRSQAYKRTACAMFFGATIAIVPLRSWADSYDPKRFPVGDRTFSSRRRRLRAVVRSKSSRRLQSSETTRCTLDTSTTARPMSAVRHRTALFGQAVARRVSVFLITRHRSSSLAAGEYEEIQHSR